MKVFQYLFTVLMTLSFFTAGTRAQEKEPAGIDSVLARMPARNADERDRLSLILMNTGTDSLMKVCSGLSSGYENITSIEYTLNGLAVYSSRPGSTDKKMLMESVFLKSLGTADKSAKAFLIRQLEIIGSDLSVPALSAYLSDPDLMDPAVQAMIAIGTNSAAKNILKALPSHKPAALIKALGELRYKKAEKKIRPYLSDPDPVLRETALFSLANMGSGYADRAIRPLMAGDATNADFLSDCYLLYARRLYESGKHKTALKLAWEIFTSKRAGNAAPAALELLARSPGMAGLDILFESVDNPDPAVQGKAIELAQNFQGRNITLRWVAKCEDTPPDTRARIIRMLGIRNDMSACNGIFRYFSDESPVVRDAAIRATAKLGCRDLVSLWLGFLKTGAPSDVQAVKEVMVTYSGLDLVPGIAEILPGLAPDAMIAAIEFLTARRATGYKELIYAQTQSAEEPVRKAALEGLRHIVDEKDLSFLADLLFQARDRTEARSVQNALVESLSHIQNPEQRMESLLSLLSDSRGVHRARLVEIFSSIGGERALSVVAGEMDHPDVLIRETAVETLSQWPDLSAAPLLLAAASKAQGGWSQAIKGAIRLLREADTEDSVRLDWYKKTMELAKSPEDRRLVLSSMGRVRTPAALDAVAGYLNDTDLKIMAAHAAADIACPSGYYNGQSGIRTLFVLYKSLPLIEDQETREEIEKHMASLESEILQAPGIRPPPVGFETLFNGTDLTGWKGLSGKGGSPVSRADMSPEELKEAQMKADSLVRSHWKAVNGVLVFDGRGSHLCTERDYRNFELWVDWMIGPGGDSGIYLRGTPQVQIWDPDLNPVGSGGLYNNQKHPSKPLLKADNPVGAWNTFHIRMTRDTVTVHLNDVLVVDHVIMENYWDRTIPIFAEGQIELQSHGSPLYFKNIFLRELE